MRGITKKPDLTNILPSVRARGILVPLIVRSGAEDGNYEIVAGKRSYHAALTVDEEQGGIDPLPIAVMEAGDDAAAFEASMIEKIAHLVHEERSSLGDRKGVQVIVECSGVRYNQKKKKQAEQRSN